MSELLSYIQQVNKAISTQDAPLLRDCLTINPANRQGEVRANFTEPNQFDLHQTPPKFDDVIRNYLKLLKVIYIEKSLSGAFENLNQLVISLLRVADEHTNWINPVVLNSCTELMSVYKVKQMKDPEDLKSFEFQDIEMDMNDLTKIKISCLEKLANTMHKGFTISLNDKNSDLRLSKRVDVYYYLANLIKIYFKLDKLELAKSVQKTLDNTKLELPDMKSSISNMKHSVMYLYYSGMMYLDNGEYLKSEAELDKAMDILSHYSMKKNKQTQQILLLLLPLKLYNRGKLPKKSIWLRYPDLRVIYRDNIFNAITEGNLAKFNASMERFQLVFLKNHLYVLMEKLRLYCQLTLIRKTYKIVNEMDPNSIVPLNAFQLAFEFSQYNQDNESDFDFANKHSYNTSLDEIECILANLIAQKRIRGYISHGNKCIVFAKSGNVFPKLE